MYPFPALERLGKVHGWTTGTIGQELGGVAVCALLVAEAARLSSDEEEAREIDRILRKPTTHFTARNANKNAAGFLATGGAVDDLIAALASRPGARARARRDREIPENPQGWVAQYPFPTTRRTARVTM